MFITRWVSLATTFIASSLLTAPSLAGENSCQHPPMPWRYGSSFSSTWYVAAGGVCTSTNTHPNNISRIQITAQPSHGVAGKNGIFGIAYRPTPGYRGSDAFTYTVTSKVESRFQGQIATLNVFVIVE